MKYPVHEMIKIDLMKFSVEIDRKFKNLDFTLRKIYFGAHLSYKILYYTFHTLLYGGDVTDNGLGNRGLVGVGSVGAIALSVF